MIPSFLPMFFWGCRCCNNPVTHRLITGNPPVEGTKWDNSQGISFTEAFANGTQYASVMLLADPKEPTEIYSVFGYTGTRYYLAKGIAGGSFEWFEELPGSGTFSSVNFNSAGIDISPTADRIAIINSSNARAIRLYDSDKNVVADVTVGAAASGGMTSAEAVRFVKWVGSDLYVILLLQYASFQRWRIAKYDSDGSLVVSKTFDEETNHGTGTFDIIDGLDGVVQVAAKDGKLIIETRPHSGTEAGLTIYEVSDTDLELTLIGDRGSSTDNWYGLWVYSNGDLGSVFRSGTSGSWSVRRLNYDATISTIWSTTITQTIAWTPGTSFGGFFALDVDENVYICHGNCEYSRIAPDGTIDYLGLIEDMTTTSIYKGAICVSSAGGLTYIGGAIIPPVLVTS